MNRTSAVGEILMKRWLWGMVLGLLVSAPAGWAAPAAAPADYRFAAGDVIEITVSPQKNFDRTLTVQPDGKISYPIAGQIQVVGLTVEQLGKKLQESLNQELVDPVVSVSLKEVSKREVGRVSFLGAVRSPGSIEIRDNTTLADALAAVGGPAPLADLRRITVTRTNGEVTTVDLSQTDRTGRVETNLRLQPGDIIVVPEGTRPTVLVLGEVAKPGSHELPREARLLDALSLAGGATDRADLHRVNVARAGAGSTRTLDLLPLLTKGDTSNPELNILLQPGDTLFVAETAQQVYVLGSVGKPGLYPLRPGDRVLDVLVNAGGAGAGSSKAVLVRRGEGGQPVPKELDLKKIMAKGDMQENQLLQPGDALFVPDKKTRRGVTDALGLVWPLSTLFSLFR
jgi:polysaccharide biosynthesis/export protein